METIPLSRMSSEEKKYNTTTLPNKYDTNDSKKYLSMNKDDINSNGLLHQQVNSISYLAKPLFNILVPSLFNLVLLFVFLHADGKPLDYTIMGLKIPSLVSLILSINVIFIASGLSIAIAEYKWVRLKNGAKLTIVDIYDSCARGISGLITVLKALHFDHILILALVFNMGLIAISPLSQEILVPFINNYTTSGIDTRFFYFKPYDINGRSALQGSGMPPKMNGLTKNAYITTSSFAQAATGSKSVPLYTCPNQAIRCEFKNVSFISTTMSCTEITENDKAIALRDGTDPTLIILKEYFTNLNISYAGKTKYFPMFLYAPEMVGRTYYDLLNYTEPLLPGLNIKSLFADKFIYDPQYRPYVGDQQFVMAYNKKNLFSRIANNYTEMGFKKCFFTSSLNTSNWQTSNGTLQKVGPETSIPIIMDYDRVLGNNTAIHFDALTAHPEWAIMVNAYIMQQSLLIELIVSKYYAMYDYLSAWRLEKTKGGTGPHSNATTANDNDPKYYEDFMRDALQAFDYTYFQAPFVNRDYQGLNSQYNSGEAFFSSEPIYHVKQHVAYTLFICLFLPIIWWAIVWFVSMREMRGVARGNSQIALLSMRMTPLAEYQLQSFSYLNYGRVFNEAKNIRIQIGTFAKNSEQDPHIAFGIEGEDDLNPLK